MPVEAYASDYPAQYHYQVYRLPKPTWPYATLGLIAVCVAAFVAQHFSEDVWYWFWLDPAALRPWMLVTSIFLHGGYFHIFFNLLILFMFGSLLERGIGRQRYVALFFLAGIVGNLCYLAYCVAAGSDDPSLGASGAIYGILGCLAVLDPERTVYLYFFPIKLKFAVLVFAAVDVALMLGQVGGIANAAHLGGLGVGLAFGFWLKEAASRPQR
jgi:membrane associated rhomboid family serine protease